MNLLKELLSLSTLNESLTVTSGTHLEYLGKGQFKAKIDNEEYDVYCPIDIKGDHGDDSEWAGKLIVKNKEGIQLPYFDDAYQKIDKELDKFDVIKLAQHDLEK